MQQQRKLAAIMFTDIVGYTALMQQDEEKAVKTRDRHRDIFDSTTSKFNGQILQYYGDGTLSIFNSAIDAVMCAMEMQLAFQKEQKIPVRIGIHQGDIIYSDVDVIGDGVNIASRIESLGVAGSVLVSDMIYEEIKNQNKIQTNSLGSFDLKNVSRPFDVYAIKNEGLIVPQKSQIKGKLGKRKDGFLKIPRSNIGRFIIGTLLVIVVSIIGIFIYTSVTNEKTAKEIANEKSIAVLPFVNMSGDQQQEYFSDGITEEILNALAQLKGLKVAGRTSSFAFKGKNENLKIIGEKLDVSTILEGSVQKFGNRIRITAQLINANDGFHIWSERYERNLDDIFAIQDEISSRIAEKLKISYMENQNDFGGTAPTENMKAYELYLKGQYFLAQRSEGVGKAMIYFQKAIELDPDYAAAYEAIGLCYHLIASFFTQPAHIVMPLARKALKKSISLDEKSASAHLLLAQLYLHYDWDWNAAKAEYNRAVELNLETPHMYDAFYQAYLFNDFDKAINIAEKVQERNPLDFHALVDLANFNIWAGRFDKARDVAKRILELNPEHVDAYFIFGETYFIEGKNELATEYFQKSASLGASREWIEMYIIPLLENVDQKEKVAQMLSAVEPAASSGAMPIILMVNGYGIAGLNDEAFTWLDRAFEERDYSLVRLKTNPYLKPLHSDPRWQILIDKIGFPK
jgi:adenylate cyclase